MADELRFTTLASAAQAALDVQMACNASGVALSMFEVARTIRQTSTSTDGVNQHPIMQLFAYKLMQLCMAEPLDQYTQDLFTRAHEACQQIVLGATHTPVFFSEA